MRKLIRLVPVLAVVAGLVACSDDRAAKPAAPETVRQVAVMTVQRVSTPDLLEAVGTVRASETSQLAAQVMGTLIEVRAREGDAVKRGQVLAVIDDSQTRAAVERAAAAGNAAEQETAAAESNLALAQATLNRYQSLFDKKSVSPQEFDEVKTRFQAAQAHRDQARAGQAQAKAALAEAHTSQSHTRIVAPFDGVITERKADAGTLASPGMAIFTVEARGRYRLETEVNEHDIGFVRMGQAAPVTIDALDGQRLAGKVVQIVPSADPGSRSFVVKVELPGEARLRSGFFGKAEFLRGEEKALVIPQSAVVTRGQLQGVYALDTNQVAGLRYVTLGRTAGAQVIVLTGLEEGDRVATNPRDLDLNGKRIEAQ